MRKHRLEGTSFSLSIHATFHTARAYFFFVFIVTSFSLFFCTSGAYTVREQRRAIEGWNILFGSSAFVRYESDCSVIRNPGGDDALRPRLIATDTRDHSNARVAAWKCEGGRYDVTHGWKKYLIIWIAQNGWRIRYDSWESLIEWTRSSYPW